MVIGEASSNLRGALPTVMQFVSAIGKILVVPKGVV